MKRIDILLRGERIRRFILESIEKNSTGITSIIVDKFKISRQAATRYLTQMVQSGQLTAQGTTKDRSYALGTPRNFVKEYDLGVSRDESKIWLDDFRGLFKDVPDNITHIFEYGFTEMVNNVLDHSEGKVLEAGFRRTSRALLIWVQDDGIGIFRKIKEAYRLSDERQSILELSKGKLTTDPQKHTGEGIFFSSRAFDLFGIESHKLFFSHLVEKENDFLFHQKRQAEGTVVYMEMKLDSKNTLKEVFDKFSSNDGNYSFDKTVVPVRLAQYEGEDLLSRSQAKRLMARVENFKTVMLDFEGVKSIGPAFSDEIFRVYKNEHPNVEIFPVNSSEEVMKMINRVQNPS